MCWRWRAPSSPPPSCFRAVVPSLARGRLNAQLPWVESIERLEPTSMSRILLYTTQFCGYCRAAKNLLRSKGLDYDEIDVALDVGKRTEMVQRARGLRTVPQIFIRGRHVGGYDELAALERDGKLD